MGAYGAGSAPVDAGQAARAAPQAGGAQGGPPGRTPRQGSSREDPQAGIAQG